MAHVAVVLCGSGFKDGSEIHESVLAMLALEEAGATVQCLSLAKPQADAVNHLTMEPYAAPRSMIEEAARIARGNVKDLTTVTPADFDAVVLPGGFGAAKNLCDFAAKGAAMRVDADLERFLLGMHEAKKPIGAICIAPVVLAKLFGRQNPELTIGNDPETAAALVELGVQHVACAVDAIVVDRKNLFVSTPAYMLGASVKDIHQGIRKLANEVVRMTK